MNEPNAVTPTQWVASANAAITAIRAAGATSQQILVPGSDWDSAATWISSGNAQIVGSGIVDPSNNFAFEVHQYLDAYGSGTSSTVVSTSIGVDRLTAITQWAEATGNKLFLGEFGVASDPTSLTALNNMLGYMAQHTDVWEGGTYWAAGAWWGSYMYSVEPTNGVDKPQMGVLEQYAQTTIEANGSTDLSEFGGHYYLVSAAGTGPELENAGAAITAGGSWVPIGAEQTATGYDVAWKLSGANEYTVWSTASSGNFIANITGAVSGNSIALESLETTFHQDLNGDGTIGLVGTAMESFGSTSLLKVGNNYDLESICSGTGPELQYKGAPVTAGQFGTYVPIGAEQTATGYDVAWKIPGTNDYTVWSTNRNGNFIANITGAVSGNGIALESLEATFHQDLNGDGVIGIAVTPNATSELNGVHSDNVTFEGSTGTLKLDSPSTFAGQIIGFTGDGTLSGSDQVDLPNMTFSNAIQLASSYDPSTGALTVTNDATVDVLHFIGSYSQDNFEFASDAHGPVAELVGIEGGVVSGVINLESSGVEASDWRPRHDEQYYEA